MPEKPITFGQIGVGGGVGALHLWILKALKKQQDVGHLTAVAENNLGKYQKRLDELKQEGIRIYTDWRDMLIQSKPDAVIISAPHHFHVPMSLEALANGIHVFTEKPPAVTIESGEQLVRAMKESQLVVGVDYMYTASRSALELRDVIQKGALGKIKTITAKGLWARSNEYYQAVPWRGKWDIDGVPVRDGCLFNQFPHLLNQCIYFVPGDGVPLVTKMRSELYRGHSTQYTQMEDTVSLYARVNGVDIFLYGTVCHTKDEDLSLEIVGEKGKATWTYNWYKVIGNDGGEVANRHFDDELQQTMCYSALQDFAFRVNGNGNRLYWDLEQALVLTGIVCRAHDLGITQIPGDYVKDTILRKGGPQTAGAIRQEGIEHIPHLVGIDELIHQAAASRKMFSELDVQWARQSTYRDI